MAGLARRLPIVVILGATGAGKSKAAIEIAMKYNGEIISADSMQIYKGLDIVTNKVTREEQQQVAHHMINIVSPLKPDFNIHNFRQMVIPKIEELLNEEKLPVIVGGTNYYIESILWDMLISTSQDTTDAQNTCMTNDSDKKDAIFKDRGRVGYVQNSIMSHEEITPGEFVENNSQGVKHGDNSSTFEVNKDHLNSKSSHALTSEQEMENNLSGEELQRTMDTKGEVFLNNDYGHANLNSSGRVNTDCEDKTIQGVNNKRKVEEFNLGTREKLKELSSKELHDKLKVVDPESAMRLHPHNKRRILRALEVYSQHQQPMSKILQQQHSQAGATKVSGPLRFPNPCVIWVQCDQTVLDERTDKRVEQMVAEGLLGELEAFHKDYNQQRVQDSGEADYTLGIFQSIGFKEFHNYLLLPPDQRKTEEGVELFNKGLYEMKLATRRYARRQKKWIVGRFLKRRGLNVPPVYAVDSSVKEDWDEKVHKPACDIVQAYIQDEEPPYSPLPVEESKNKIVHNYCDVCEMVFVTLDQWENHIASRRHQKAKERLKRQEMKAREANDTVANTST